MKLLILVLITLTIFNTHLFADDSDINPDTARAYQGYLLTFIWPSNQTSEHIDYQNILSIEDVPRLGKSDTEKTDRALLFRDNINTVNDNNVSATTSLPNVFDSFKDKIEPHAQVLVNQQWTLIFKHPGDVIEEKFHSIQIKDDYPELTGTIAIKLGRYLESDIQYKHFIFDSFSKPEMQNKATKPLFFLPSNNEESDEELDLKSFEPALSLEVNIQNKTASKKINYLDHPIIGTLLYFEPMDLEDAIQKIAEQSMVLETGNSLNYDTLQSTNELFDLGELIKSDPVN